MRFALYIILCLRGFYGISQNCADKVTDLFSTFKDNYEEIVGDTNLFMVNSNSENNYHFDLIFSTINWNCIDTLEILLFDGEKYVYSKKLDRQKMQFIYLTNFEEYKDNLVVRIDLEKNPELLVQSDASKRYKVCLRQNGGFLYGTGKNDKELRFVSIGKTNSSENDGSVENNTQNDDDKILGNFVLANGDINMDMALKKGVDYFISLKPNTDEGKRIKKSILNKLN